MHRFLTILLLMTFKFCNNKEVVPVILIELVPSVQSFSSNSTCGIVNKMKRTILEFFVHLLKKLFIYIFEKYTFFSKAEIAWNRMEILNMYIIKCNTSKICNLYFRPCGNIKKHNRS